MEGQEEINGGFTADTPRYVQSLADQDAIHDSPIDINITKTEPILMPPLNWYNLEVAILVILSAKWYQERPYIAGGPFMSNYVFSQLHFHWGKNDAEGSEHTIDGIHHPIEMHVVMFKGNYLTQESAMKEKDGIAVLVYLFKLQGGANPAFQILVDNILAVQKPHTSVKLNPVPLSHFVKKFEDDYFLYWGSVTTSVCLHYILWLVNRVPVGVTSEQVEELRAMLDANEEPLMGNFRSVQPVNNRHVFHVSPGTSKYSTLLPLP